MSDDRIYPLTWVTINDGVVTVHALPPSVSSNWTEAFGEGYAPAARIEALEAALRKIETQADVSNTKWLDNLNRVHLIRMLAVARQIARTALAGETR